MTTWSTTDKTAAVALSGGNLVATSAGAPQQSIRSTTSKTAGLVYWEVTLNTVRTNICVGFATAAFVLNASAGPGGDSNACGFYAVSPAGALYVNGANALAGPAGTNGEIVYFAINFTAGLYWVSSTHMRSAGTPWNWDTLANQNPATNAGGQSFAFGPLNAGPYFALFNDSTGGAVATANFGATAFNGTVPAGFAAWDAVVVIPPVLVAPLTSGFYVIEATILQGFADPVGPADEGWLAQPWLALSEVEAAVTTSQILRASDVGYVSRATDPQGVQAYPARISDAITVDVAANLDLTASNVAASWGSVALANTDNFYDALIAAGRSDGQVITIYRGDKTFDTSRGIYVDPPFASLQAIFRGVMGAWDNQTNKLTIPLHDASFYLDVRFPRRVYAGTGGKEGTAQLVGVTKPILFSTTNFIHNVSPLLIDPANLVYQFTDSNTDSFSVVRIYDGGVQLGVGLAVADVYAAAAPAAGFYNAGAGLIRLGSTPVFELTGDVMLGLSATITLNWVARIALDSFFKVPFPLIGSTDGVRLDCYGVSPAVNALAIAQVVGYYIASGETLDGITFFSRMMSSAGLLLVPGRDAKLRLLALAAIPAGTTPVLTFDDTTVVSITSVPLPAAMVPPPWRLRLGYDRNWTLQDGTQLAGGAPAAVVTFDAAQVRAVTGIGPAQQGSFAQLNDPPVLASDGYATSTTTGATQAQPIVNAMIALWGVQRYLYEIVVPQAVGMTLDWASVVRVVSDFDGLQAGKLGQIVGWRYSSAEATTLFRVLV